MPTRQRRRTPVERTKMLARRTRRRDAVALGDSSCSTSPRWMRGGIGFLLGGMLGGMIGGGIATAVATSSVSAGSPSGTLKGFGNAALIATGVTVVGGVAGLAIGAAKPEC